MEGQIVEVVREKILGALERPAATLTPRDVVRPAVRGKALAVIGMRRAGKTTYLHQIRAELLAAGRSPERLVHFGFEDERLADLEARDLGIVIDTWRRLFPEPSEEPLTLFLDEMQRIPGWELFVRRLLDTPGHELFLSGSSAKLLSREVATSMRGRALEVVIRPFHFREFLRHQGREPKQARHVTLAAAALLERDFVRYLREGGFPEAQGCLPADRRQLLTGYVDILILRDVVERHHVANVTALRWLVRRLLGNAAGTMSVSKLAADFRSQGIAVGKDTLHELVRHLEDAFLLTTLPVATDSEKRRQSNPRKVYPVDTGLVPLFDRSGKENLGHLLETAVCHELERRGAELAYAKNDTGTEVDFVARFDDGELAVVQVCASLDDADTLARELRGLGDATSTWPRARRLLLTLEHRAPFPRMPKGVEVMAAWQWMLEA
ncbi:MAG: ATP-binding protein [Polyangiaceae bacterium]|nr:ATP-binding protein [Polyangiaceae bacterium]